MKKNIKWIAGALALIMIIAGAYILYNKLMPQFKGDSISSQTQSQSDSENQPAPDFTVTNSDGKEIKLSDLKGKPVVINFWATWCHYCKVEMPDIELMYQKYGDEIEFMIVNMTDGQRETVESAKEFIKKEGFTFPVYFDTLYSASYNYNVTSLPATYFVNAEGELVAGARGAVNAQTLEEGISMIKQ